MIDISLLRSQHAPNTTEHVDQYGNAWIWELADECFPQIHGLIKDW